MESAFSACIDTRINSAQVICAATGLGFLSAMLVIVVPRSCNRLPTGFETSACRTFMGRSDLATMEKPPSSDSPFLEDRQNEFPPGFVGWRCRQHSQLFSIRILVSG